MRSSQLCSFLLIAILFSGNGIAGEACTTKPSETLVLNVKDKGALGDGIADDTDSIQSTINEVAGSSGTVLIPSGTYMIDAVKGLVTKNDLTIRIMDGAKLQAMPNSSENYSIINILNSINVNLIGGTLIGDRESHIGLTGEWGMGVTVRNSKNVVIDGVTVKEAWGDGFYITGSSKNIVVCNVVADNNRRQGMSIISVDGLKVTNSTFKNTAGTAPQAGIDIEPNAGDSVNNVTISGSNLINNKGFGIMLYVAARKDMSINNVTISNNLINGNQLGGIFLANTSGNVISSNVIKNLKASITFGKGTAANIASRNKLGLNSRILDIGNNLVSNNELE